MRNAIYILAVVCLIMLAVVIYNSLTSEETCPSLQIDLSAYKPETGESVIFTLAGYEEGEVLWMINDEIYPSSSAEFTNSFIVPGDYTVEAMIPDCSDTARYAFSVVEPAPIAIPESISGVIIGPSEGKLNQTLDFLGDVNVGDDFVWSIAGEKVGDNKNLQYRFTEAGDFLLNLQVSQEDQVETFFHEISIKRPKAALPSGKAISQNQLMGMLNARKRVDDFHPFICGMDKQVKVKVEGEDKPKSFYAYVMSLSIDDAIVVKELDFIKNDRNCITNIKVVQEYE